MQKPQRGPERGGSFAEASAARGGGAGGPVPQQQVQGPGHGDGGQGQEVVQQVESIATSWQQRTLFNF